MCRLHRGRLIGLVIAGALIQAAAAGIAQAAVSQEAAAARIKRDYGVEVLKVRAGQVDGHKVWLVTVMEPGGNRNNAFQVNTLAVDQDSGALIPSFRHYADGYSLPPLPPGAERP